MLAYQQDNGVLVDPKLHSFDVFSLQLIEPALFTDRSGVFFTDRSEELPRDEGK